jgi:hypothetical protein
MTLHHYRLPWMNRITTGSVRRALLAEQWRELTQLAGIDVKEDAADLVQAFVFFDPNCPACSRRTAMSKLKTEETQFHR